MNSDVQNPDSVDPKTPSKRNRPMKIVIVDDSKTQLQIVENTLQSFGEYKVLRACDGEEALYQIDRTTDLILTDWSMPNMDGLQLVKKIRESYYLKDIPIIMITSKGDSKSVVEAMSNGVDDFIVKPLRREVLAKKINIFLVKDSIDSGNKPPKTGLNKKNFSKLPQKKPVVKLAPQPPVEEPQPQKHEEKPPPDVAEKRKIADKKREQRQAEENQHQKKERDLAQVQLAREVNEATYGHLQCEVCGQKVLDIEEGEGKCEFHFDAPPREQLSGEYSSEARLQVVCTNCHKIIHSQHPYLEVGELRKIMQGD